jgi:hypothetical protein
MANVIDAYDPIFYAQEALILLEKALGMAGRIHRGYDEERKSFRKGSVIQIKKPSTFTAKDAPSTPQDLSTSYLNLNLDQWKEVKFTLTDQELAYTGEKIINDHIRPAAYALADDIDQKLAALYTDIPWYYDLTGTLAAPKVSDLTGPRRIMFDNAVPLTPGSIHYMVDGTLEEILINSSALAQAQGAGEIGTQTQMRGYLGYRYGMEVFANQNVQSHTKGTYADGSADGVVSAAVKGATSITITGTSITGTILKGDVISIAGDTQQYAATADATAAGNSITVSITPALAVATAGTEAATVELDDHTANLAFHRNAFALATAPLSEMGNELGAKIATITDPITGLSIRSRLYYLADSSEVRVALDILYGFKTLDPNLACRGRG